MRLFFFTAALSSSLFGSLPRAQAAPANTKAQELALNRIDEALTRVVTNAKKVNAKLRYGFLEQGCVFGVMMRPGGSTSESFILNAGQSYVFIGGGDNSARNVDVILRDSGGKVVGKDTERDASPFVLLKPKRTGRYTMSLRFTSGRSGTSFCAMTVLRKGGLDVPLDRLKQTVIKAALASAIIFRAVNGGRFNQDSNTWALYGAVLVPGQSIACDPKPLRSANRGFLGVGDDRIQDLDVLLLNRSGQTVASDTKNGAVGGLAYATRPGSYSVGLINNASNGPSLVMAVSLELPAGVDMSDTATNTPSSQPQRQARSASPFAGHWSGSWEDNTNNQDGELKMTVRPDGSLAGRVINDTLDVQAPVTGTLASNGALRFSYSYAGQPYLASGRLEFGSNNRNQVVGTVAFSSNGSRFGSGDFELFKRNK